MTTAPVQPKYALAAILEIDPAAPHMFADENTPPAWDHEQGWRMPQQWSTSHPPRLWTNPNA
eukprot:CAMPEP_0180549744 /NCGR_PEP_ID=MMETSP1036_2-20121128/72275_1 /TAXON_ID=632150 /ORGANISM="Azadinium spinosum, Strain 3D9" /LENGTH=61 /DNA_ID=CAMNT_0022564951 /DNA_START=147 /DNA_END=333 /DNA_ORIENTATION=+